MTNTPLTQHPAPITKAVFPVAGLGTRFLPATKAQPKEMLPIVDKPLIQYAVQEAYEAGIRHMIFVTGRNKRAIEDHFDTAYELESELEASQKDDLLQLVRSIQPEDMVCSYVRQHRSLGLGHAILCAEHLIGHDSFAVLLADDLMVGTPESGGILTQMVQMHSQHGGSILACQEVPLSDVHRYGIVAGTAHAERLLKLHALVEKPKAADAPSRLAVAGRYILSSQVFDGIRAKGRGVGGEIQLTDGIASLMTTEAVFAYHYIGQRFDCGSKIGFLEATVSLGLAHPELGAEFNAYLRAMLPTLKA